MMEFTNKMDMNKTAIKKEIRANIVEILKDTFEGLYTAENISIVGNNTLSVCCGTVEDEDGCPMDVCFEVKPVVKNWYKSTRKSGGELKVIEPYDRLTEEEIYMTETQEKEEENKKKKAK